MPKIIQLKDKDGDNCYPVTQETVLYNNDTGSTGTITLSETAANFKYIEIFTRDTNANYQSVKLYQPNNKTVILFSGYINPAQDSYNTKMKTVKILGTTITPVGSIEFTGSNTTATNYLFIHRVVGYK